MAVAAGMLIWTMLKPVSGTGVAPSPNERELTLPTEPIALRDEVTMGADSAKVVLVQYSEFQCPFCSRFAKDTLPPIIDKYVKTGKLQVVFRHYPLQSIHPLASAAGAAAACANAQGTFWPLHDFLFEAPENLEMPKIRKKVAALRLDTIEFESCLTSTGPAKVKSDRESAIRLGVRATPTVLMGERLGSDKLQVIAGFVGMKSADNLAKLIDKILARG